MKKALKRTLYTVTGILLLWTAATFWAEYGGTQKVEWVGDESADKKALVVYNPDPIYNLDEQVCKSFATGLLKSGFTSKIATTGFLKEESESYDLYVFCANTYNWAPDWLVTRYIRNHPDLEAKKVVAFTLGSGSTVRSKRLLEEAILSRNADLIGSKTYWLMRPNDEGRMKEKNVDVVNDMVMNFGREIGRYMSDSNL